MDNKGGKRSGAGRPKGSVNKSTAEIKAYAQKHGKKAIQTLVTLMEDENIAPATRRAAAADVLDRGYGRPAQAVMNEDGSKLFPDKIEVVVVKAKG